MAALPTRVYQAINEAGIEMHGAKNRHRELRQQIAGLRNRLAGTPGLQLMTLADSRKQVYPVMITDGTGGFLGIRIMEYCFLGVDTSGMGHISACAVTFDDFLIYLCSYNGNAIDYIFQRAMRGEPLTFDEVLEKDMSSEMQNQQATYNNTVVNGQIVNASGNATVNASVNIPANVPLQFQNEYQELIKFLQNTNETGSSKTSKINKFVEKLLLAGFGEIAGEIAKVLFGFL